MAYKLHDHDKRLTDYGLPEPQNCKTELERALLQYDPERQLLILQQLDIEKPNTIEQQHIYDFVMNAIRNNQTELIFIQGFGGGGKTTIAKKILAASRSAGILCVGCASTALAATNYDDFDTAHGLFKYPVDEDSDNLDDDNTLCKLQEHPERLELLFSPSKKFLNK